MKFELRFLNYLLDDLIYDACAGAVSELEDFVLAYKHEHEGFMPTIKFIWDNFDDIQALHFILDTFYTGQDIGDALRQHDIFADEPYHGYEEFLRFVGVTGEIMLFNWEEDSVDLPENWIPLGYVDGHNELYVEHEPLRYSKHDMRIMIGEYFDGSYSEVLKSMVLYLRVDPTPALFDSFLKLIRFCFPDPTDMIISSLKEWQLL